MSAWKYYQRAMLPTCLPYENADETQLRDGTLWKSPGHPLFARWTTDWDCAAQTAWWWCIKDTPFHPEALNAKKRYEITKGNRSFTTRTIAPLAYVQELFEVQSAAYAAFPEKYRPTLDRAQWEDELRRWCSNGETVLGCFARDDERLCGYARLKTEKDCIFYYVHRVLPQKERCGINAALVYGVLQYYEPQLAQGAILLDGERNINHESAFQAYLEKYFGFRRAYCVLHLQLRPSLRPLLPLLKGCRRLLLRLDGVGLIHSVNAVLAMLDCAERCKQRGQTV